DDAAKQDPERAVGNATAVGDQVLVHVFEPEQHPAKQKRVHRAPAEPPERAQQQLRVHLRLQFFVQVALEGRVDQVEEVQVPDPDDAESNVAEAQKNAD